jgi:hypothetical protein
VVARSGEKAQIISRLQGERLRREHRGAGTDDIDDLLDFVPTEEE